MKDIEITFERLKLLEFTESQDISENLDFRGSNNNYKYKLIPLSNEIINKDITIKHGKDKTIIQATSIINPYIMPIKYGRIYFSILNNSKDIARVQELWKYLQTVYVNRRLTTNYIVHFNDNAVPLKTNDNNNDLANEVEKKIKELFEGRSVGSFLDSLVTCIRENIVFDLTEAGFLFVLMKFPTIKSKMQITLDKSGHNFSSKEHFSTYFNLVDGSRFYMSNVFSDGKPCLGEAVAEAIKLVNDEVRIMTPANYFFNNSFNDDLQGFSESIKLYGIRH